MGYFGQKEYGAIMVRGYDDGTQWIAEMWMNGNLWDHIAFENRSQLDHWLADPFADERAKNVAQSKREAKAAEEMDRYHASSFERVSRGRRVGRKPSAA